MYRRSHTLSLSPYLSVCVNKCWVAQPSFRRRKKQGAFEFVTMDSHYLDYVCMCARWNAFSSIKFGAKVFHCIRWICVRERVHLAWLSICLRSLQKEQKKLAMRTTKMQKKVSFLTLALCVTRSHARNLCTHTFWYVSY